jgi:hypothetical protein
MGGIPLISGTHIIIHSKDVEADRASFSNVLGFALLDAGHGWMETASGRTLGNRANCSVPR